LAIVSRKYCNELAVTLKKKTCTNSKFVSKMLQV
jgi:hypothetical protein